MKAQCTSSSVEQRIRVAIVGCGPRGLSVLERIIHYGRANPDVRWEILVFDKHEHGPGCHVSGQSRHLLLNTAADQITLFPKQSEAARHTMTFDEWILDCLEQGLHRELIILNNGSPADSYQPRALFGHYLIDVLASLVETRSANTTVDLISAYVHDMNRIENGTWTLAANDQHHSGIDYVYLCTGHNINLEYVSMSVDGAIANPFPIRETMAGIPDSSVVAIRGLGLTAMDVIAELTQGRGGRFEYADDGKQMRYHPSGREPHILAFSRTGLPLLSRPVNEKTSVKQRQGRHFTQSAIESLQSRGPIDFARDLLPLIIKDMEEAWQAAVAGCGSVPGAASPVVGRGSVPGASAPVVGRGSVPGASAPVVGRGSVSGVSSPSVDAQSDIPANHLLFSATPAEALTSPSAYRSYLIQYLANDVEKSREGNVRNPIKAAYDVLRDSRERMAHAVDFGGLAGASQAWFYDEFLPLVKRLSVGPPKERILQMLALIDAGILTMDFGPNTRCERAGQGWEVVSGMWPDYRLRADYWVDARLPMNGPGDDPLIARLVEKGVARYFENGPYVSGGLEVDSCLNVVDFTGTPVATLWALGVVTEGTRFYTFFLPRPYARSRFEDDAEIAVRSMIEQVTALGESIHESH